MTNRQWLETLSDKQLADWLNDYKDNECELCRATACVDILGQFACARGIINWLKQEHKSNSTLTQL